MKRSAPSTCTPAPSMPSRLTTSSSGPSWPPRSPSSWPTPTSTRSPGAQENLRQGLSSRATIDYAIGILIAQGGLDPESAFGLLVKASQRENRKLRDIAAEIVERALAADLARMAAPSPVSRASRPGGTATGAGGPAAAPGRAAGGAG